MKIFVVDKTRDRWSKIFGTNMTFKVFTMSLQCVYICKNNFI